MKKIITIFTSAIFLIAGFTAIAQAQHAWGNYHWGRTANPFTLELGDNLTSDWKPFLATAATDWNLSSVLDTVVATGKAKGQCRPNDGRVEICNDAYGNNGWLGIAQIWVSGEHIVKGAVKLNDTYYSLPDYNTPEWKNLVMCQEVGHTLGLGHTDENFDNAPEGTCMDYSADPAPNQHPNAHDYEMLEEIYAHLDSINTIKTADGGSDGGNGKGNGNGRGKPANAGQDIDLNNPAEWGQSVKTDAQGNTSLFAREMANGEVVFTFVTWVDGHDDHVE